MAGDWDASLAEADLLARVPEMAAHVRAAGLLVQVGRGDPAARERLAWARALIPRLHEHVLLGLVTAGSEIDLAAWDGDAATAVEVAPVGQRRLQEQWEDDHLGVLRLVGHGAGAGRRRGGGGPAGRRHGDGADRWVARGEELAGIARSAVDVYAAAYGAMGVEARGVAGAGRGRGRPAARRGGARAVAGRGRGVRLRARVRGGPLAVAAGRGAAGRR